jgi:N-acetylmuramoyl-L-alanine amidase
MSDRNGPESRWSSVRERDERNKRRAAEREAARRERLAREQGEPPPGARRLSDEERQTIRQYRFPSSAESERTGTVESPQPPASEESTAANRPTTTGIGTRWRDSAPPPPDSGPPRLPDLPGDNGGGGRRGPGNSRLIIFGISLFAAMLLIAYLPFGPLGGDDDKSTPTPSATLPSILDEPEDTGAEATTAANEPRAEAGQAIVCIDPGHGGWDPGWVRSDQEVEGNGPYGLPHANEAEINLGMAWMLRERLEAMGYFVVMTRESGAAVNAFDEDVNEDGQTSTNVEEGEVAEQLRDRDELQARINVCNEADADILISVHVNGFDNQSARGYEVFYTAEREFGEQNQALATFIYREMDTALRETDMGGFGRGADPDTEAEVVRHDFGTSRHYIMTGPAFEEGSIDPSLMPGVIVECAFLSNDLDAAWLVQTDNQELLADAYARGIQEYFAQYPPS